MKFQPKLRDEVRIEFKSMVENGLRRIIETDVRYPFKTCLNCDHFEEKLENCKIWKTRPPARVIAFGCDKFDDKEWIPF